MLKIFARQKHLAIIRENHENWTLQKFPAILQLYASTFNTSELAEVVGYVKYQEVWSSIFKVNWCDGI